MSEKKPRKGKGQFKVKTPKINPPQNNLDKIRQLAIEADRYLKDQNYEEEIKCYDELIKLDSENKIAYLNRGVAHNELGNNDRAIIDYTKAIDLDPKYKEAYNNRGVSYHELKKYKEAIIDYTNAITLNPKYTDACNNRAYSYSDLKEYNEAIIDFDKVIELDPTHIEAHNNRAITYYNKALVSVDSENYDEALDDLTLYVEHIDKVAYQVYFLLIDLYKTKKIDIDKIADLIKAIINKQKKDSFESKKTNRDEKTNKIIDIIKNKNEEQIDINSHTLYSYVPFDKNTIDAIVQGYKYANEIFDFNDPTDPTIKLIPETKEIIEILKNIRIACFSTSPLSTLMYSHYTDKHKGICIEYDFSDFDTENTSLLEVKYKEELKIDSKIFQIMMKSDNDINEEISFLDLFRTKHLNWEYEKEYRVITYDEADKTDKADKTDEANKVGKIYRPIKAIYLGKDISDSDIELIKTLIKGRSIKLYQVALHEYNVFRLEATEIIFG